MSNHIENNNYIEEEDTQLNRFLTFSLDNESYAIKIKYVIEILGLQPITEIPDIPKYIKGIINLRGKIIPVMDVRLRFRKEEKAYNDRTCVIIVEINNVSIGLIVDAVSEVIVIPEENIVAYPTINNSNSNGYISKIGKVENEVKMIIECKKLIFEGDLKILEDTL